MSTITIGMDLAKSVFSVCEVDGTGHVLRRLDLKRDAFAVWLAQVPAGTVVAMEACSGAHHGGRRCLEVGLQPRLMAAQLVKPYRKSQRSKNDRNDAEAIATAARQGNMRFVPVKSIEQQARLSWHRVREGYKVEGLAIGNRLRGLLAEFGIKTRVRLHFPCPRRGNVRQTSRHHIGMLRVPPPVHAPCPVHPDSTSPMFPNTSSSAATTAARASSRISTTYFTWTNYGTSPSARAAPSMPMC